MVGTRGRAHECGEGTNFRCRERYRGSRFSPPDPPRPSQDPQSPVNCVPAPVVARSCHATKGGATGRCCRSAPGCARHAGAEPRPSGAAGRRVALPPSVVPRRRWGRATPARSDLAGRAMPPRGDLAGAMPPRNVLRRAAPAGFSAPFALIPGAAWAQGPPGPRRIPPIGLCARVPTALGPWRSD